CCVKTAGPTSTSPKRCRPMSCAFAHACVAETRVLRRRLTLVHHAGEGLPARSRRHLYGSRTLSDLGQSAAPVTDQGARQCHDRDRAARYTARTPATKGGP